MASPPPHLPSISIPRKRNSVSSISSAAKKRKPSQLRNAFSPESEGIGSPLRYSRSPSVDSVATGSIVNSVGGRKRKRKDGDTQSVTGSLRGAKAGSVVTGVEGEGGDKEGDVDEEEEDEEDEEMDAVLEGGRATEASLKQEKEHERFVTLPNLPLLLSKTSRHNADIKL
ncbi:hypothetical protein M011DRAFT_472793 [Sporormia fimetaria CBS 119925]|uniref:Uncharacterized protein n=1 Tax=Sporormia fimetaria CBS 119925 TaxID=1340428 RepID=A0A6A6UVK8_9PLEO|nr:hypothetical protein M011DRAFT_472793 [Sporormia fimetaria CBS 119925]